MRPRCRICFDVREIRAHNSFWMYDGYSHEFVEPVGTPEMER